MIWNEKGSTLTSILLLVGISGTIYTLTEKSINNGIHAQKVNLAGINHNDLEKKVGTLCSSLFTVKKGASMPGIYTSPQITSCVEKNGSCTAINNPNLDKPNVHDGYPIHLFNSQGDTRQVGTPDCPAYYTVYGSPTSVGANIDNCQPKILDAFAVFGSVSPSCGGNTATCQSAATLKVKCVVNRLESNYGRTKNGNGRAESYTVNNYDINGFMCPNTYVNSDGKSVQQAVVGIDGNGQFICAPMRSVIGLKGDKGDTVTGPPGNRGPDGNVNVKIRGDGCFAKDTLILTNQGEMAIQDIDGDELIWNPSTKKYHELKTIVKGPEEYDLIKFIFQGQEVAVTRFHPMTTSTGTKQAYKIKKGDLLMTMSGYKEVRQIEKIRPTGSTMVYNLEIWSTGDNFDNNQLVANGVVTGDLRVQKTLKQQESFEAYHNEIFSFLSLDLIP